MIESYPVQIRAGGIVFIIFYKKESDFCFFSFLEGSSIKRQKAKEYICYFRDNKIFVLFFHIVVDYMYMLS